MESIAETRRPPLLPFTHAVSPVLLVVRASLGLPPLRGGSHFLEKKPPRANRLENVKKRWTHCTRCEGDGGLLAEERRKMASSEKGSRFILGLPGKTMRGELANSFDFSSHGMLRYISLPH
ncbi:MAG: hypothetical protein CVU64_19600 [Deltaproteobacteria bacterium HGW-Deltaproteobacteria-21]|nr:MAG: hypothetical protein CVU64_19600 [Deltaproteobacteria bacterium HGW-Deltaproteobacteria-21]